MSAPSRIAPFGVATISVPASSKIAVQSLGGIATVTKIVGAPNNPGGVAAVGTVNNTHTVFGTFSTAVAVSVVVEAGAADVWYEVSTAPEVDLIVVGDLFARGISYFAQPVPTALTATATLTVAQLLTGIITDTHSTAATATYTLPTGTLTDGGVDMAIGDSFDWSLINLSAAADTVTVAAGTDHTLVGLGTIPSAHSTTGGASSNVGTFRTKKTAALTFVTYRI